MRADAIAVGALCACLLGPAFVTQAAAQTPSVIVTGVVTDSLTSGPVEQTTVLSSQGKSASTGKDGRFRLELDAPLGLLVIRRVGYVPRTVLLDSATTAGTLELGTITLGPLVYVLEPVTVEADETKRVALNGLVRDSVTKKPIENATIYLPNGQTAMSDRGGTFRLGRVRQNSGLLFLRRLGYQPRVLFLRDIQWTQPEIDLGSLLLAPRGSQMDARALEADLVRRNPRLRGFYQRRRSGRGIYVTREEIWGQNPETTSALLRAIPGVSLDCSNPGGCTPASFRSGAVCDMAIVLDGVPVPYMTLDEIEANWIAGIELYRGANTLPLEITGHRGGSCGTVVVWTGATDY